MKIVILFLDLYFLLNCKSITLKSILILFILAVVSYSLISLFKQSSTIWLFLDGRGKACSIWKILFFFFNHILFNFSLYGINKDVKSTNYFTYVKSKKLQLVIILFKCNWKVLRIKTCMNYCALGSSFSVSKIPSECIESQYLHSTFILFFHENVRKIAILSVKMQ